MGLMILKKQLIMNIGKTENDLIITETMVKNSLDSFVNKPIVQFANPLGNSKIIGYIQGNICIENNDVYADIFLIDSCKDEWKGKYDNWGITLDDDKESFQLDFIEVF